MERYAVYDNQAIWGTGSTELIARADCHQWLDPEYYGSISSMACSVMTEALVGLVESKGGSCGHWLLSDGRLGTHEEADKDELSS